MLFCNWLLQFDDDKPLMAPPPILLQFDEDKPLMELMFVCVLLLFKLELLLLWFPIKLASDICCADCDEGTLIAELLEIMLVGLIRTEAEFVPLGGISSSKQNSNAKEKRKFSKLVLKI